MGSSHHISFALEPTSVLFEGTSVRKVILNRPQRLNSLNHEMVVIMLRKLREYEKDPEIKFLILKGNGKAFCAGGDVMGVMYSSISGHWTYPSIFYHNQLTLDYMIATYKKPVVSLINGFVMGGGAGLSMNTTFRIVTEKTVFAMPESCIGLFPDVGASYFLSRLPGHFGEYLGLTGARLGGSEMLSCGLATHFVLSKDLSLLETALEKVNSDPSTIGEIIGKFAQKPLVNEDSPLTRMELVTKCFSKNTVEDILQALIYEMKENRVAYKWVVVAVDSLKRACPLSLKVFLRSIREARSQKLDQCLGRDHIIMGHMLRRKLHSNFYEGARAMFFDKDMKPKWAPSNLEEVGKELVDQHFVEMDDEDFKPLKLPQSSQLPLARARI